MCKAWIDNDAMQKMYQEAMRHFPLETGGCLMGYRTKDGDVVIVDIVGPGPDANHEAYTFEGNTAWQNEEVGKIFNASNGQITYIGDWHTHPNNPTTLSNLDVNCLNVIAEAKDACCPSPVMLVMGFRADVIDVFQYPETSKPLEIKQFDFEGAHA